jgi:hypothetical protein
MNGFVCNFKGLWFRAKDQPIEFLLRSGCFCGSRII